MKDTIGYGGLMGIETLQLSLISYINSPACAIPKEKLAQFLHWIAQDIFNQNIFFDRDAFIESIIDSTYPQESEV